MLTKTIPELQQFIKSSDAKSAAYAAQVLEVIHLTKKNIIKELEKYEPKTGN